MPIITGIQEETSEEIILTSIISYLSPPNVILSSSHFVTEEKRIKVLDKYFLRLNTRTIIMCFLLRSGNIHPNPGPPVFSTNSMPVKKSRNPKFPCSVCSKGVIATSKSVICAIQKLT